MQGSRLRLLLLLFLVKTSGLGGVVSEGVEREEEQGGDVFVPVESNSAAAELKADLKGLLSDFNAMLQANEADEAFDRILLDQVDDLLAEEAQDANFLSQLNGYMNNTRDLHNMAQMIGVEGREEISEDKKGSHKPRNSNIDSVSRSGIDDGIDLDMLTRLLEDQEEGDEDALGSLPTFDEL